MTIFAIIVISNGVRITMRTGRVGRIHAQTLAKLGERP
jgi:hypothetical protein